MGYLGGDKQFFEPPKIRAPAKSESDQKGDGRYYPFGLSMAGISDKALKTNYAENKYRFQKQELQNKEFSDGSGLEMYEFKYRFDDCQLGRFWSIDPIANEYEYNSPYAFSEDKVTGHVELEGLEAVEVIEGVEEAAPEIGHAIAAAVTATGVWLSSIQASPGSTSINGGSMYAVPLGNNAAMNMSQPAATIPLTSAGQDAVNKMNEGLGLAQPQGVTPKAPLVSTMAQANSNQGSGEGRGSNNRKPDPEATGDHTVSNDRGSTTYQKNDRNPSGFQEVKRVDTKGKSDNGVPTPHVHEGGKVRPANPDEIPKTDLNKNKPPTGS
jgi:RHS repeat-associated protein